MAKGVCRIGIVPMRAEPKSASEMKSQLLFGETYEILEEKDDWIRIKTDAEKYEAWISKNQAWAWEGVSNSTNVLTQFPYLKATEVDSGDNYWIPCGSLLHEFEEKEGTVYFSAGNLKFSSKQMGCCIPVLRTQILDLAKQFLNAPYLWGGRSFMGIDCSGFTQLVFRLTGIWIDRDAWQQTLQGEQVSFLEEARIGDLAFFDNEDGRITHVGLISGKNEIIHASGKVRIDMLDSHGIYRKEEGKYSHKLRVIKRYF